MNPTVTLFWLILPTDFIQKKNSKQVELFDWRLPPKAHQEPGFFFGTMTQKGCGNPKRGVVLCKALSSNFCHMAVGQNLRYLFGDDYPSKVVYFKGFWDVHRGTGVLTRCHITLRFLPKTNRPQNQIVFLYQQNTPQTIRKHMNTLTKLKPFEAIVKIH